MAKTTKQSQNKNTNKNTNKNAAQNTANDLGVKNNKLKEDNMKLFLQVTVPQNSGSNEPIRPENDPDPINALFAGGRLNLKG